MKTLKDISSLDKDVSNNFDFGPKFNSKDKLYKEKLETSQSNSNENLSNGLEKDLILIKKNYLYNIFNNLNVNNLDISSFSTSTDQKISLSLQNNESTSFNKISNPLSASSMSTSSGPSLDRFDSLELSPIETLDYLSNELEQIFENIELEDNLESLHKKLNIAFFWHKKKLGDIQYLKEKINDILYGTQVLIDEKQNLETELKYKNLELENTKKEKEYEYNKIFQKYTRCVQENSIIKNDFQNLKQSLNRTDHSCTHEKNDVLKCQVNELEIERERLINDNSKLSFNLTKTQDTLKNFKDKCINEYIKKIDELSLKDERNQKEIADLTQLIIKIKDRLAICESTLFEIGDPPVSFSKNDKPIKFSTNMISKTKNIFPTKSKNIYHN